MAQMLFDKETYVARRKKLMSDVRCGLILLFGNNDSPANYPANTYHFRQDSSFLYFFGLQREGLVGVIDADEGKDYLFGDDISIDDIIWYGKVESVAEMAAQCGAEQSAPMSKLADLVDKAKKKERKIHFLPPYRHDLMIQLMDLTGIHPAKQKENASLPLIKAVVEQRAVKSDEELKEIARACETGYEMHTTAMRLCKPGVTERHIAGVIEGIAMSHGAGVSFPTILSMHGEIMHGTPSDQPLENGRLMLCDAGAETINNYCSDNTRTTPVSGRFTQRQREIYSIVEACHDLVLNIAVAGTKWWDVHFKVAQRMTQGLQELGLMQGDIEESVRAGAHALFFPHGIGHMMGLDVHDMESLGQEYVGFDDEVQPSTQFGTNCLRCGRRLQKNWVMTDEPGIYFIPALIDDWRKKGLHKEFINYDKVETYKDFGGIRIEDDIIIREHSEAHFISRRVIPYHLDELEKFLEERPQN